MNTEQWTAALRSGKYSQGQNTLCDGTNYCCLGVLAEEAGFPKQEVSDGVINYIFDATRIEDAVIPSIYRNKILEDLDLTINVPSMDLYGEPYPQEVLHNRLMSMNDNGVTFEQIAAYIEQVKNENS